MSKYINAYKYYMLVMINTRESVTVVQCPDEQWRVLSVVRVVLSSGA